MCSPHVAALPLRLQPLLHALLLRLDVPQQAPVATTGCRDDLPEDVGDNPDAAAIQAILDETSPEEAAEGFKARGLVQQQHTRQLLQSTYGCHACGCLCRTPGQTCSRCCCHASLLPTPCSAAPTLLPTYALRPAEPGQQRAEDGAASQEEVLPAPGHRAVRQGAGGALAACCGRAGPHGMWRFGQQCVQMRGSACPRAMLSSWPP